MTGTNWTDAENDAIVADYFAMLKADLSGASYVKAHHNRGLQGALGRSRGSIEYKYQNVSAVLMGLGEAWIDGYKPAFNFQDTLIEAVARHLSRQPAAPSGFREPRSPFAHELTFGPPPTLKNEPEPKEAERLAAVARRFDVAGRQERDRALGRAGEERVLHHERSRLRRDGREDLADRVRWVSDLDGDGAGYDIASFARDGAPRLIEVKTTNGWERTPFHISRNELRLSRDRADEWCLVRLWNFARRPAAFEIRPPLERHVGLMPTSYEAAFVSRT